MADDLRKRFGFFYQDLERLNSKLHALGAVTTTDDGFMYVDESKVPAALASAYRFLGRFGYANGLLGPSARPDFDWTAPASTTEETTR